MLFKPSFPYIYEFPERTQFQINQNAKKDFEEGLEGIFQNFLNSIISCIPRHLKKLAF